VSPRSSRLALAAAVALQAGLSIHAMRGQSATFDEGAHLPAGYTHLALGDHRLNPEQPPLVKLIAATPLLAIRPQMRTDDRAWAPDDLKAAMDAYRVEHEPIRFDPEARNLRHTHVSDAEDSGAWRVHQMLIDPDMHNDWVAAFEVDLAESRDAGHPALRLCRLGSLA